MSVPAAHPGPLRVRAVAATGMQDFQDYMEKHCLTAVVLVELQKLARGNQWNLMLSYLTALAKACFSGNIQLFVFFNHALEKGWLHEWVKRQTNERQMAQEIVNHVQNKGTPPPNVWFLLPMGMALCIHRAFICFHVKVVQSIEDHHQEVTGVCKENSLHGLVAYDSDYALCNILHYFSVHVLKLSRNGKSLATSQYLMYEAAKQLDLNPNRFPIFSALL
ncbi:Constitutive Coactivator Of Ppar-Gamma-Like Protein 1 [Manis pentadactyla]|nr:Constitutive Coactivator Of Ppar-Gamma-Like Protein 1 [Manis pentadactyla]